MSESVVKKKGKSTSSPRKRTPARQSWLERGEKSLEEGDTEAAIKCAESGLAELGDDYADPGVEDDTGLKLHAARDLIERGRAEDGARLMLRMLKTREALCKQRRSDRGN